MNKNMNKKIKTNMNKKQNNMNLRYWNETFPISENITSIFLFWKLLYVWLSCMLNPDVLLQSHKKIHSKKLLNFDVVQFQ